MAISGGPDIVEDGLLFHVDAADKNSYPGTGNTWYDLSGNGYNFTLVNSPLVAQERYFDFSTNEYAYLPLANYTGTSLDRVAQSFSAEIVFQFAGTSSRKKFFGNGQYGNGGWNIGCGYNNFNRIDIGVYSNYNTCNPTEGVNCQYNRGNIGLDYSLNNTEFFHYLFTYSYVSQTSATSKLYVNGTLVSQVGTNKGGTTAAITILAIGANTQGGWSSAFGNVGFARMYDRVLSTEEVEQNYKATKARFSL